MLTAQVSTSQQVDHTVSFSWSMTHKTCVWSGCTLCWNENHEKS